MKFANLPRETKLMLMDQQSALSKLRDNLEAVGRNINKITKYTDFRTHTIFEQKSILINILFKCPCGNASHFAKMIRVNDYDEIKNVQRKLLEGMREHLIAENYTPEF